jgi:hypothetical protein
LGIGQRAIHEKTYKVGMMNAQNISDRNLRTGRTAPHPLHIVAQGEVRCIRLGAVKNMRTFDQRAGIERATVLQDFGRVHISALEK